ncbi:MORN_motif [Hexamita inflata]|uniref:MORN motif n=1 Tax=Hexamita inflata TaxID=28002 RepID=A0AA86RHB9_9EUKA|nr:MORN motif [Hexamita inflata]
MSEVEIIITKNYQYIGDVVGGLKHGKGALIFNDGGYYVGNFVNDRFSGSGTFKFNNQQQQLFGFFKNGDFQQGDLICQGFRQTIQNGSQHNQQSVYENNQNKQKQVTILETQQGDNKVVHFLTDGSIVHGKSNLTLNQVVITPRYIFVGEIQNEKMNGTGVLVFNDGSVFNGKFMNNKFDGVGTFTFAAEIQMIGRFIEGDFYYGNLTFLKTNQTVQVKNYDWKHHLGNAQYDSDKIQDHLYKIQANSKQVTLIDTKKICYQYLFEAKVNLPTQQITDTQTILNQNTTNTINLQSNNQTNIPVLNCNKQNESRELVMNKLNQYKDKYNNQYTNIIENKQALNMSQNDEITELKEKNGQLQSQINLNSEKYKNIHKNVDEIITQRDNALIQCKKYEKKLDEMLQNQKWFENQYKKLENSNQQYIIQLTQHAQLLNEEHEKLNETNLQTEKQEATIKELELKCYNIENTATEQKNNFSILQTEVQNKNDQIVKQELELNTLKQSISETTLKLNNENEIKLQQQQFKHDNVIKSLQQQHQRDVEQLQIEKQNIQQRAEQYAIQVQNEAKQWIANEQNRLTQEFSIKEQTLLNQLNTQREQEKQKLLDDLNVQKQALEIESKQTSELKRQITALETQLKQKQLNHVSDASEIQKPKQKQEPEVEKKIEPDLVKIIIDLKDYQEDQLYEDFNPQKQVQEIQNQENQLSCNAQDSVDKSTINISISESDDEEPNIQHQILIDLKKFPEDTKQTDKKYDNEVKQDQSQIICNNSNQQFNLQQNENNVQYQNDYSESSTAEIQIGSDSDADNEVQNTESIE